MESESYFNDPENETRLAACKISTQCIADIKAMRMNSVSHLPRDLEESDQESIDSGTAEISSSNNGQSIASESESSEELKQTQIQVNDEDHDEYHLVMVDTAGAQEWGPQEEHDGPPDFEGMYNMYYTDYLYRLPIKQSIRIRHKEQYCDDLIPLTPSVKRFSDTEAAK